MATVDMRLRRLEVAHDAQAVTWEEYHAADERNLARAHRALAGWIAELVAQPDVDEGLRLELTVRAAGLREGAAETLQGDTAASKQADRATVTRWCRQRGFDLEAEEDDARERLSAELARIGNNPSRLDFERDSTLSLVAHAATQSGYDPFAAHDHTISTRSNDDGPHN